MQPVRSDMKLDALTWPEMFITFIFGNEDHTFGNPLRHILMQNPDTDFCGYSVPHPYEPRLNLRLQTNGERSSMDVLISGLTELESLCNIMESKFNNALEEFQNVVLSFFL